MITDNRLGNASVRRAFTRLGLGAAAAALLLLAAGGARADTISPLYQADQISMTGDQVGTSPVSIPPGADLFVEGLADTGLLTLSAAPAPGALPSRLLQWADGVVTPIVTPGGSRSPHWPLDVYWPQNVAIDRPVSINANGDVVFSIDSPDGNDPVATYWWAAANQTAIKVRLAEEPATGNLVFTRPGGAAPAINNRDEIALVGQVSDPYGTGGFGLFFLDQFPGDQQALRPVLLPGEALPVDSPLSTAGKLPATTSEYFRPSIDDSGRIAFLTQLQGNSRCSAYVWEYGSIDPVMIGGASLPPGGRITNVSGVWLNDQDRSALVTATTNRAASSQYGLYRSVNDAVMPIAAPGKGLPGGGTLQTVQYVDGAENTPPLMSVSAANTAGQVVFLATLTDGSSGAYLLDPDGTVTPVYQADSNDFPPGVTFVPGSRPCINNQGQIALSVRDSQNESVVMLLTPVQM